MQELSPIVLQLCREALNIWDGKEKQDLVLETLSFVQLKDFQGKSQGNEIVTTEKVVLMPPKTSTLESSNLWSGAS